MADAGDVVADKKSPMTHPVEPGVDFGETLFGNVKIFPELTNHAYSCSAADGVAEADAAPTSGECGEEGSGRMHNALGNEVSAIDQQRFIRNGQADHSEHQKQENGPISVLGDPCENMGHQPKIPQPRWGFPNTRK